MGYGKIGQRLGIHSTLARHYALRESPPYVERYNPDLTPSSSLAYLLGFWLGDGRASGKEKKVQFELADKEQLEFVNRVTAQLPGRQPKAIQNHSPFYIVVYDTSLLYDYLNQPLMAHEELIQKFKADFIRGFFDAEGYVGCSPQRTGSVVVYLGAANTDIEYLGVIERLLNSLGIDCGRRITNKKGGIMTIRGRSYIRRKDVWHVFIKRKKGIQRFSQMVGFWNERKASRLSDVVRLLDLPPAERYRWFVANYAKRGRYWVPIGQ